MTHSHQVVLRSLLCLSCFLMMSACGGGGTSSTGVNTQTSGSSGNPKTALHPGTQQLIPSGTIDATQTLGYAEYVPAGYPSSSGWPLIIYFHGDGALGTGDSTNALSSLLNEGIPMYINLGAWDSGKRFVVLSPQMKDYAARSAANVDSFIQFAKANYKIDPKRIYLSSLSGGGAALYRYLYTYSGGEAAAVIPVSSVTDHSGSVCGWKQVPTWIFHGGADQTLPFATVALPVYEHLKACSPAPVPLPKLTSFVGIDHEARAMYPYDPEAGVTLTSDSNYDAYQNIYDWLLQHHN